MMQVEVLNVLGIASIQDGGRTGMRRYGVPVSGFMDRYSAMGANEWLGKAGESPLIELLGGSVKLSFTQSIQLAITGAYAKVKLGNEEFSSPCLLKTKAGLILEISAPIRGHITYLAFEGEIRAKQDFDSYSTLPQAGLGGLEGRYLKRGDTIEIGKSDGSSSMGLFRGRYYADSMTLRCYKGPEFEMLDKGCQKRFFNETFLLTNQVSRIGYRLSGQPLAYADLNLSSRVVERGTVQLPPDGQPIVLMADAQTTGGYPRIGQIAESDIDLLAQMRPGSHVRFLLAEIKD